MIMITKIKNAQYLQNTQCLWNQEILNELKYEVDNDKNNQECSMFIESGNTRQ